MIIWTMLFLALNPHSCRLTLQSLVIEVVILFLFPAVTAVASIVEFASIGISFCLISGMPKSALNASIIFKDMRFSAEVLPIMSILALVSQMTFMLVIERAPDSFEMKEVKVCVVLHLVKHVNA